MLRSSDTALLSPAGWSAGPAGGSAHFLNRRDAHHREAGTNDPRRRRDQSEARARLIRLGGLEESKRRVVLASVPQHMKVGRQVIEKKRYPVRFPCDCGAFDGARPEREAADQGQFGLT